MCMCMCACAVVMYSHGMPVNCFTALLSFISLSLLSSLFHYKLNLSGASPPLEGSELTNKPFRWDQRLFTVMLRFPGIGEERNLAPSEMDSDNGYLLRESSITALCERTGGEWVGKVLVWVRWVVEGQWWERQ